jgi:hypothetical protein
VGRKNTDEDAATGTRAAKRADEPLRTKRDKAIRGEECKVVILARFSAQAYESWRKRTEFFHRCDGRAFTRRKAKEARRERIGGLKFCENLAWMMVRGCRTQKFNATPQGRVAH